MSRINILTVMVWVCDRLGRWRHTDDLSKHNDSKRGCW